MGVDRYTHYRANEGEKRLCTGNKLTYPSVKTARRANSRNHHCLRVYWCTPCGGYHVAKKERA